MENENKNMSSQQIADAILAWQAQIVGISVDEQRRLNKLIGEQYKAEGLQLPILRRRDAPVTEEDIKRQEDNRRIYLACIAKLFQSN